MGGGDNELIINTGLDLTGFKRGTQQLKRAIDGTIGSVKKMAMSLIGFAGIFGTLSKAVSTYMSQNQQLSKQMSAIWTALGNLIGPIIERVCALILKMVSYLLSLAKIMGLTTKTASQLSKAMGGAGGAVSKTIAGFDELNVLNDNSGGGAGRLQDMDPLDWMKDLVELLKNKMWDDAADIIIKKINEIFAKVRKKLAEAGDFLADWVGGLTHILARVINEVNWSDLGAGIAEFFNNVFSKTSGEDLGAIIVGKLTIAFRMVTGFLENLDFGQLAELLSGMVVGALNSIEKAIRDADFKKIGAGIREFFENIDWEAVKNAIFGLLETAWNAAVDLLWGVLAGDSEEEPPIIGILRDFGEAVGKFVEKAVEFGEKLKPVWDWIKENIIDGLLSGTLDLAIGVLESLTDMLDGLIKLIDGDINFGEFIGQLDGLSLAISGIATAFGGLKIAEWIKDLEKLVGLAGKVGPSVSGLGGAVETAGTAGAQAAVGIEATGVAVAGVGTALAGGALAALGLLPVVLWDSKLNSEYAAEAFDGLNGNVEGIATKMNELSETASHLDDCLNDTTGWTSSLGWSMQESRYAADAYNDGLELLAASLGITTEELKKQIEAADGDVTKIKALSEQADKVAKSESDVAKNTADANKKLSEIGPTTKNAGQDMKEGASAMTEANELVQGAVAETATQTEESMSKVEGAVDDKMTSASDISVEEAEEIKSRVIQSFEEMKNRVIMVVSSMADGVMSGFETMRSRVEGACSNLVWSVSSYLGSLSSYAWSWGADMMSSMANGIYSRSYAVANAAAAVAQSVRNIIGFSEPKEGPLSDFHTYGPDMMELYAQGIEQNKGKVVDVVDGLASTLSDITNNVSFGMPAIAAGGIVPYGVGAGSVVNGGGSSAMDIASAVYEAVLAAMEAQGNSGQRVAVLEVNGREFCRATYYDQQAVAKEHGINLVTNG